MLHSVLDPRPSVRTDVVLREIKRAVDAGKKTFLIVPEQAAAAYEALLARHCGAPGQKVLEVSNFSRLRDVVLRETGGVALRVPDGTEKELLLALTLTDLPREAALLCRPGDADAVSELAADLEEARAAGLDEAALGDLSGKEGAGPCLSEKLAAASLVAAAWRRRLAALADVCPDPEQQLCDALDRVPFFRDARVFIHDFRDFTVPQFRVIRRLMTQAEELWVTLPCGREREEITEKPYRTYEKLLEIARDSRIPRTVEETEPDEAEDELSFLRRRLTRPGARWEKAPQKISVTVCDDELEEAAFVADRVRRFVTEENCAWREIAVLSRGGETDRILSQVLSEREIPHYLEKKQPLAETGSARLVLLAAKIALDLAFRGEEREYLQNPLLDLPEEERYLLEKYVETWRLTPAALRRSGPFQKNPDGYGNFGEQSRIDLARINAARERVIVPLQGLALSLAAGTVAEKVTDLISFLRAVGAEDATRRAVQSAREREDFEAAAAAAREWNCVLSRLGALAEIAGERTEGGRELFGLLGIALGGDAPGEVPPAQDAVFIGTVDFARPEEIKKLFLIGMNAGVFPRGETPGRLFSEGDRKWIHQQGFSLSHPDLRRKEEAFYFSLATLIPSEELLLSWRANGDAARDKGAESIFVKRCHALFPALERNHFQSKTALPRTRRDAFRALLSHLEDPGIESSPYFQYFAGGEEREILLRAAAGQSFCRDGALREEMPYAGRDFYTSYSGIEEYNKCHFKFFANHLLKAKDDPSGELDAAPVGTFIHALLEELLRGMVTDGVEMRDCSEKDVLDRADGILARLIGQWFGAELSPALKSQMELVRRDALALVKILWREAKVCAFRPVLFEQTLDGLPEPYTVPLPDGRKLILKGTIDRVDLYRSEAGEDYVRVVDYKSGKHDLNLSDLASGLDLQMLLYLFALWDKPVPVPDGTVRPKPAGILYVTGAMKDADKIKPEDEERVATEDLLPLRRTGLFVNDEELLRAQDSEGKGYFLPVLYLHQKNSPSLLSAGQLGRVRRRVEKDLAALARDVLEGKIEARRLVQGAKDPCDWCPYLPLCKRESGAKRYGAGGVKTVEDWVGPDPDPGKEAEA